MIGNPDVIEGMCEENCTLKKYREHTKPKANSLDLCPALETQSDILRQNPEMADWDFELKAKLLIVEGNIGVGKTTLSQKLADRLSYRIFLEPTTENPYLGKAEGYAMWVNLTPT